MKTLSTNKIMLTALILFFAVILHSCQKENNSSNSSTPAVTEQDAANLSDEGAQADAGFDDVADVSMVAADEENNASTQGDNGERPEGGMGRPDGLFHPFFHELRAIIGDCATITVSPNDSTYPKTITIDFGDSCVGLDGKLRSGSIVLHLTGPIRHSGSVMTITLVNYYLNHVHLEGTKVISNLSDGNTIQFTVEIVGGKVTFRNGRGYSYASFKNKKQVAGMDTPRPHDNVYQITGWAKIQFNNGTLVSIETVDPLVKKVACPWITDGTLKIKINDRSLKIDYGFPHNGDCDNKALLLWNNGNSQREIELP
jgi:hypothetical protein